MGYAPLVYKTDGGDTLNVESGGKINIKSGAKLQNDGVDLDLSAGIATSTTSSTAELNTLTGILATKDELNRAADVSTRLVAAGATLAVTVALHDGKIIKLDTLAGSVCTLPAATGSGAKFTFVVTVAPTSNAHKVQVTTTDIMKGFAIGTDDEAPPVGNIWPVTSTSDTISLDGSTQGGAIGDRIEVIDSLAAKWTVMAYLTQTGTEATPFSAAVS